MRPWFLVVFLIAGAANADEQEGREGLNATLWMQQAPEYRAITEQIYRLAAQKIAAPAPGSAALEQKDVPAEVLARMPTAVVMDLDETVLDNTVYQARLLRDRETYGAKSWGAWVGAGEAEAVPGAREFIATARKLGHTVFFLTNRDCTAPPPSATDPCPAQTSTMKNLVALGIDLAPDPEHLLLRKERPDWNNGIKTTRRAFIAEKYRIVALVGDDLGDFVDPKTFAGDRERLEPRFGASWFLLPNPIYGSLDQSLRQARAEVRRLEDRRRGARAARRRCMEGRRDQGAHRQLECRIPDDAGDACGAARRLRAERWHGGWRPAHAAMRDHEARSAHCQRLRHLAQVRGRARRRHRCPAGGGRPRFGRAGIPGLRLLLQHARPHAEEWLRDPAWPATSLRARIPGAVAG